MKDFDQYLSQKNLHQLIREGEHENQDFKYKITSSVKIARTLSAFANTSGGHLLVGVRDNGQIAGVKDEDDIYMIESAADVFLKPHIDIEIFAHRVEGKLVWEVVVPEGKDKPYVVEEKEGLVAYYRCKDENFAANAVLKEVWRQELGKDMNRPVHFSEAQQRLVDYMKTYDWVSVSKCASIMKTPRNKAIKTLARLIRWEVVKWKQEEGKFFYGLH